jgi:hypothetical protein
VVARSEREWGCRLVGWGLLLDKATPDDERMLGGEGAMCRNVNVYGVGRTIPYVGLVGSVVWHSVVTQSLQHQARTTATVQPA